MACEFHDRQSWDPGQIHVSRPGPSGGMGFDQGALLDRYCDFLSTSDFLNAYHLRDPRQAANMFNFRINLLLIKLWKPKIMPVQYG